MNLLCCIIETCSQSTDYARKTHCQGLHSFQLEGKLDINSIFVELYAFLVYFYKLDTNPTNTKYFNIIGKCSFIVHIRTNVFLSLEAKRLLSAWMFITIL